MILTLNGLGFAKVYNPTTGLIAKPNESLSQTGKVPWDLSNWIEFHKGFIDYFRSGKWSGKTKLSMAEAVTKTYPLFVKNWNEHAGSLKPGPFTNQFVDYFKSVGLSEILKDNPVVEAKIATAPNGELVLVEDTTAMPAPIKAGVPAWRKYALPVGLALGATLLIVVAVKASKKKEPTPELVQNIEQ